MEGIVPDYIALDASFTVERRELRDQGVEQMMVKDVPRTIDGMDLAHHLTVSTRESSHLQQGLTLQRPRMGSHREGCQQDDR